MSDTTLPCVHCAVSWMCLIVSCSNTTQPETEAQAIQHQAFGLHSSEPVWEFEKKNTKQNHSVYACNVRSILWTNIFKWSKLNENLTLFMSNEEKKKFAAIKSVLRIEIERCAAIHFAAFIIIIIYYHRSIDWTRIRLTHLRLTSHWSLSYPKD